MTRSQPGGRRPVGPFLLLVLLAAASVLAPSGCGGGAADGGSGVVVIDPTAATFRVMSSANLPVVGASVFLIPAWMVDDQPITGADILSGQAADRDEPLEDVVRLNGPSLLQGVTDADGRTTIDPVPPGRYFWFVQPAATDDEHLPGGNTSRRSRDASTFVGVTSQIMLSGQPPATAQYLGSTNCLLCHSNLSGSSAHAHRLALTRPGQLGSLQDDSFYPGIQAGWNQFAAAASFAGGTPIWFSDYDSTRGADKFLATTTDPSLGGGPAPVVQAWLWRDTADGRYKITLVNLANPADPRSPRTLIVDLTYGGALHRQSYLVRLDGVNRDGLYPFLQWQNEGDDAIFERERKVFRDYALDRFFDINSGLFVDPQPDQAFQGNCTGCHSTGFQRFQGPTGEWLSSATDDFAGVYDIDADGMPDEINVGCESCHGPGSEHASWASQGISAGGRGRYIVQPRNLSPSRALMVCGRCHDRPLGNGPTITGEPIDPNGLAARPGIGRQDFLAQFTTRPGPETTDYWDGVHSRRDQQHVSDLLKSRKHRNDRILTVCSDCHGAHGASFRNQLTADPDDPDSPLCATCHATDHLPHMLMNTGSIHTGSQTSCTECHMPRTGLSGAGRYGLEITPPVGDPGDVDRVFFENDVGSHLFSAVPRKTHPSVAGRRPGLAMPIPYTNSCGAACHDGSPLPFLIPIPRLGPLFLEEPCPRPRFEDRPRSPKEDQK